MPQDVCCCSISTNIGICVSRCNWDQSFVDSNPLINKITSHRNCKAMNDSSTDHCYQNVNTNIVNSPARGLITIPLGSEWDPVKIPKNVMEDIPVTEQDTKLTEGQDESSERDSHEKAKNSLFTVVRRACTRSPRGSTMSSPSRSPTSASRGSGTIVINPSDLDGLSNALDISGLDLNQSCNSGSSSGASNTQCDVMYENIDPVDTDTHSGCRKCSQNSNPFIEVTPSDTDSVFSSTVSDRPGISSDKGYPRSEFLTSFEDSGLSLAGSELANCRRSSSSACLGEAASDVLSDVGSAGFSDNLSVDIRYRTDNFQESSRSRSKQVTDNDHLTRVDALDISDEESSSKLLSKLELCRNRLRSCAFYMGRMSADEAREVLVRTSTGTFLLRDSSDERFVYSISVQTPRGPTSIRVGYFTKEEEFYLDSEPDQLATVPKFPCVLALIQFYVRHHATSAPGRPSRLEEPASRKDCSVMLLKAYEPKPPSLLHASRRVIHRQLQGRNPNRLYLIPSLKNYLNQYPYDL